MSLSSGIRADWQRKGSGTGTSKVRYVVKTQNRNTFDGINLDERIQVGCILK